MNHTEAMPDHASTVPPWATRLIRRLLKLEQGQVYIVIFVMQEGEPVWCVQPGGKVENRHR